MDDVLTAIDLTFPGPTTEANLTLLKDGLTAKYGTPTKSLVNPPQSRGVPPGVILFWENDSSVVEFQQIHCGFDVPGQLEVQAWASDMIEVSRAVYCADPQTDRVSPRLSRVFYVYKPLAGLLSARIKEALQKATDKAKSDF